MFLPMPVGYSVMTELSDEIREFIEGETFGALATKTPDGVPHVTVVWVDYDGEYLRVNTGRERQKVANASIDPSVGIAVIDPARPYQYVSVQGEVVEFVEDGAVAHYDELGRRYLNEENLYEKRHADEGQVRIIWHIRPDNILTWGFDD